MNKLNDGKELSEETAEGIVPVTNPDSYQKPLKIIGISSALGTDLTSVNFKNTNGNIIRIA